MSMGWWWRWREKKSYDPAPLQPNLAFVLLNPISRAMVHGSLRRAGLREGMSVLDIGCGPGRLTVPAARAVGPTGIVVAFDLQREMLSHVERRARQEGLANIKLVQGAIGSGVLPTLGSFDRALLVTVIGEVPVDQRLAGFREIRSALKPDGQLIVSEHFMDPDYRSPDSVRELATAAGFGDIRLRRRALGYEFFLGVRRDRRA
jgi:ubiquinone/menaquinone biosynthesis C-methylase UbiE